MENLMYALSNWINDSWILTKVLFSSVLKYEPIQQQIVKYMEHNVYLPRIEKKNVLDIIRNHRSNTKFIPK